MYIYICIHIYIHTFIYIYIHTFFTYIYSRSLKTYFLNQCEVGIRGGYHIYIYIHIQYHIQIYNIKASSISPRTECLDELDVGVFGHSKATNIAVATHSSWQSREMLGWSWPFCSRNQNGSFGCLTAFGRELWLLQMRCRKPTEKGPVSMGVSSS